jgi:hypothetical protein
MRRHVTFALTAAAVASLAAGCGSSSSTDGGSPAPPRPAAFSGQGISFTAPAGWTLQRGTGNLVATVQAGDATVAVWRYARKQTLPASKDELKAARDGLVGALTRHDDAFEAIKTAPTEIAGRPAVQIRAHETMAGVVRTVRSTHIYASGNEYVVDAYAGDRGFRAIDAQVFRPLLRSLTVEGAPADSA